MLDAAELRRASATDAGAVAQYLSAIDSDELDALLDAFAESERKKSGSDSDSDTREWHALVHVLLRTRATRQRTATRVLQALWRGHASEMEALRWVSELSLAYMASVAGVSDDERVVDATELRVVLQIALQFVRDALAAATTNAAVAATKKALPQLLALVPVLLHLLVEASATSRSRTTGDAHSEEASSAIVHEHVVQLLELPWDLRSVPYLLELLREHTTLVSKSGWTQLRQSVAQLVAPVAASQVPADCINPLVRECLLLAASQVDAHDEAAAWINVARLLVRRLPAHMRQEAEFNMHMSFHQYPSLADLVCDVLLGEDSTPAPSSLQLDPSDAVLLLHAIRASKPLLHHHLVGSALVAAASDNDSIFSKAQRLILCVLHTHTEPLSHSQDTFAEKRVRQTVASIVEFGGRQVHARVWKAQALHELARVWSDVKFVGINHSDNVLAQADVGELVMETVYSTVPEVREEILQNLLESTRVVNQSERALAQLRRLVENHMSLIVPYRQLLEDWLSSLASMMQHSALLEAAFVALAPLVASLKDFYNFSMVLLRKQLSSPHASDRQLAIDVWCSWLESRFAIDPQQEEEVVLAIKHAVQLNPDRVWTFQRLARVFHTPHDASTSADKERRALRHASLAEFHRLFTATLREFLEPTTNIDDSNDYDEQREGTDSEEDADYESLASGRRDRLRCFTVSTLDACYAQNSSVVSALRLGESFESALDCLVGVEQALKSSHAPINDAHLGRDVVRWLDVFVRHREVFFQWISSGVVQLQVGDSRFVWALAARVSLGCAFCNLALRRHMGEQERNADRIPPSVWGLLESQLSIVRLWRKFSATTPLTEAELSLKDHQLETRTLQSAAAILSRFGSQLLSGIVKVLNGLRDDPDAASSRNSPSLDGILFLLDTYIYNLSSTKPLHTTGMRTPVSEFQALVTIYSTVALSTFDPATTRGESTTTSTSAVRFTTYGEAIAAQYPTSMRHLVTPDSATALTVALDARATDEVLSRVCLALSKAADAFAQRDQLAQLRDGVSGLVQRSASRRVSDGDSLARSAVLLLDDMKCVIGEDGYAKYRLAVVALVRKLTELASQQVGNSVEAVGDREHGSTHVVDVVADMAYELLCDHVVHQPPLLRGLLMLSFPSVVRATQQGSAAIDRAAAVLAACGFADETDRSTSEAHDQKEQSSRHDAKKAGKKRTTNGDTVRVRRRRLRQISDDDEEEEKEEKVEKGSEPAGDTPRVDTGDGSGSEGSPVSVPTGQVSESRARQPRFTTMTSQGAALITALSSLESLHTKTMQVLLASARSKTSGTSRATANDRAAVAQLLPYVRQIHSLFAASVFVSTEASWVSVRTLSKLSSVVESAVRIGKHCCSAAAAVTACSIEKAEGEPYAQDGFVQSFMSSVSVTIRGRTWFAMLRDATTQPAAKSKLSSTILKLDVFLLDVPTLVASLMKATTVSVESKRTLRVFLSTVEADLALSTSMAKPRSSVGTEKNRSSAKRHLVGVVPIVHTKRRKRLRSRHAFIDSCLAEEDGDDAFADLEDFIA